MPDEGRCLLPNCNKNGPLKALKLQAVKKRIQSATERGDNDTLCKLQAILDSQGENASVDVHKNRFCSFTSKDHKKRLLDKRRREDSADGADVHVARVRRSQVKEFDFKKQCLFCADICEPLDPQTPRQMAQSSTM